MTGEYRVLVTGSRFLVPPTLVHAVLDNVLRAHRGGFTLVVGDCPRGADHHARQWAARHSENVAVELFVARWDAYGRRAGPLRNQRMVDSGADEAHAFFSDRPTPGTDDCLRRLVRAKVPVQCWREGPLDEVDLVHPRRTARR